MHATVRRKNNTIRAKKKNSAPYKVVLLARTHVLYYSFRERRSGTHNGINSPVVLPAHDERSYFAVRISHERVNPKLRFSLMCLSLRAGRTRRGRIAISNIFGRMTMCGIPIIIFSQTDEGYLHDSPYTEKKTNENEENNHFQNCCDQNCFYLRGIRPG